MLKSGTEWKREGRMHGRVHTIPRRREWEGVSGEDKGAERGRMRKGMRNYRNRGEGQ